MMCPSLSSILSVFSVILLSFTSEVLGSSGSLFNSYNFLKSPDEVTIVWNVTASTPSRGKQILSSVAGAARRGKFHAIIGPSGSGKTSLLSILANNVPKKSLILEGKVLSLPSIEPIFVQQDDLLFSQLSVIETLDTSAALRLTYKNEDAQSRRALVDKLTLDLGLKKVRETKVGDTKTRGVSGGEKKRLCIGNECIGSSIGSDGGRSDQGGIKSDSSGASTVIFCDEPTSGLDSYQAQRVVELLKGLAGTGCTVVSSIHQPRASVVAMFDDITLLAEGYCIYSGPLEGMKVHFKACGYPCPYNINPAEHYVDLVSVDYSSPELEQSSKARIQNLANIFADKQSKDISSKLSSTAFQNLKAAKQIISINGKHRRKFHFKNLIPNFKKVAKKFTILFGRAWKQITRDKALNIARLCSSMFSALLFGAIYFRMGSGASTVPDRLGLLQVAAVNTAMTALIKATTSFVSEKQIVQRERRSGAYTVTPYFLSKLFAEAPLSAFFPSFAGFIMYKLCGLNPAPGRLATFLLILTVESFASTALGMAVGSLAPSVESAIAISPAVMVIFIVFGGLYVVHTPAYLQWVPKISLIRWAYEALCVNEFTGLVLVPESKTGPLSVTHGEQVLENMGYPAGKSSVKGALLAQTGIILFNYLFTYLSLVRQKPDFESVKEVGEKEEKEEKEEREDDEKPTKVVFLSAADDAKSGGEGGRVGSSAMSKSSKSRIRLSSVPMTVMPKQSYFSK